MIRSDPCPIDITPKVVQLDVAACEPPEVIKTQESPEVIKIEEGQITGIVLNQEKMPNEEEKEISKSSEKEISKSSIIVLPPEVRTQNSQS